MGTTAERSEIMNVVITGSSKGIGKGYAREFLKRGHNVGVSGRNEADLGEAVAIFGKEAAQGARILGCVCDVVLIDQVERLWAKAVDAFGSVDIWINNAGFARTGVTLRELEPREISAMVAANVTGTVNGLQVALGGMRAQGKGHIYNTLGGGHDGRVIPGMLGYGTTKRAVDYICRSALKELKGSPLKLSMISPGVNISEGMLREVRALPAEARRRMLGPINLLGDHVETTTPWLVEQILQNESTGRHIKWLTTGKLIGRLLRAPFKKRDLFSQYEIS